MEKLRPSDAACAGTEFVVPGVAMTLPGSAENAVSAAAKKETVRTNRRMKE